MLGAPIAIRMRRPASRRSSEACVGIFDDKTRLESCDFTRESSGLHRIEHGVEVFVRGGSFILRIETAVGENVVCDELVIHVTNVEQTTDMIHGLGIVEQDVNVVIDPGETKTIRLKVTKPGVFPFYCTNFCSALHQEMQGYLTVKPEAYVAK